MRLYKRLIYLMNDIINDNLNFLEESREIVLKILNNFKILY